MQTRSTNPEDYQGIPRQIAAMAKSFSHGDAIAAHTHSRDQFLYAAQGMMRLRTSEDAWIVPTDRAVYIPAGTQHSLVMRGQVEMRTLYIRPDINPDIKPEVDPKLPRELTVLEVTPLLHSLILALLEEPVLYDLNGRAGMITGLIIHEIMRARRSHHSIPMPRDRRLTRICEALLADPNRSERLDDWAQFVGASPRTISRLFVDELGLNFTVWRQRVRFHHAWEALLQGDPISRVAQASGYRSPSAFTAAFRKVLGVVPSSVSQP